MQDGGIWCSWLVVFPCPVGLLGVLVGEERGVVFGEGGLGRFGRGSKEAVFGQLG